MEKSFSSCGCQPADSSKLVCPHCKKEGVIVSGITLQAQLKEKSFQKILSSKDSFNFCNSKDCFVVYYSSSGEYFTEADMKEKVTCKNSDVDTPLCYCKRVLKKDALEMIERGEKDIPARIKERIYIGVSLCEQSNPRGVCCSEDIEDFLKDYGIDYNPKSCCEESEIVKQNSCGC